MSCRIKLRSFAIVISLLGILAVMLGFAGAGLGVSILVKEAPPEGAIITGQTHISVEGQALPSMKSMSLSLVGGEPGATAPSIAREYGLAEKISDTVVADWDTSRLVSHNGRYSLVARVVSHAGEQQETTLRNVIIDNPPAVPAGLQITVVDSVPRLVWQRNSEPDLIGYSVMRANGSLPAQEIAVVREVAYNDVGAPKGVELTYSVAAVRKSAVSEHGKIVSSAARGLPVEILVEKNELPVKISAAAPVRVAPIAAPVSVQQVRHEEFEPLLPYRPAQQTAGLEEVASTSGVSKVSLAEPVVQAQIAKPPFIATSLLLLGAAAHLLRLGNRMRRRASHQV